MEWLPIALLSAFSVATADALTKRYLSGYSAQESIMVRLGLTGVLLAPMILINPLPPTPTVFWVWIAILIPLEVLAMSLYVMAIRDSPLSLTLPYLAFTPVFVIATGWLILGETITPLGSVGVCLVVIGTWLLNIEHATIDYRTWMAPFRAILRQPGARLMLAVAVIYSVTSVLSKEAMQYVGPIAFGPFYFALIGLLTILVLGPVAGCSIKVLWRKPGWHVLIALAMAVMVISHFLALDRVEVAYMISVKRASMLFGILYGAWWFSERQVGQHLLAGALMLSGVALIAFN